MFNWLMTDTMVERRYVDSGRIVGDAVSYFYLGQCAGFTIMLAKWEEWEAEYANRGYRTIPLDDFVEYGGYGIPPKGLGMKRGEGEKPMYHARTLRLNHVAPTTRD